MHGQWTYENDLLWPRVMLELGGARDFKKMPTFQLLQLGTAFT